MSCCSSNSVSEKEGGEGGEKRLHISNLTKVDGLYSFSPGIAFAQDLHDRWYCYCSFTVIWDWHVHAFYSFHVSSWWIPFLAEFLMTVVKVSAWHCTSCCCNCFHSASITQKFTWFFSCDTSVLLHLLDFLKLGAIRKSHQCTLLTYSKTSYLFDVRLFKIISRPLLSSNIFGCVYELLLLLFLLLLLASSLSEVIISHVASYEMFYWYRGKHTAITHKNQG